MKNEILAPAKDYQTAIAAFNAGADAIYCGYTSFSARSSATNFSLDDLCNVTNFAHLRGRKVYLALNTIIDASSFRTLVDVIDQLIATNVDAFIIQDLGLLYFLSSNYSNLELHASTQMHVHNLQAINLLKNFNVSRVVLPRELSKDEILNFKDHEIELELFVYGAICLSYSGLCNMSYFLNKRSGNRGNCSQVCRHNFTLLKNDELIKTNGEYLLSPKDNNLLEHLDELNFIDSFKIEGRLKNISYVKTIVNQMYKKVRNNHKIDYSNLLIPFNRGLTDAYYKSSFNSNFFSTLKPNHQGVKLGVVSKVVNDGVYIKLDNNLYQFDGIRFDNGKEEFGLIVNFLKDNQGKLISSASKGEEVIISLKQNISEGALVFLTSSVLLEKQEFEIEKYPINSKWTFLIGDKIKVEAIVNKSVITLYSEFIVEKSDKILQIDKIKEKINQIGDTPYTFKNLEIVYENDFFVPISIIKNLRRELINQVENYFLKPKDIIKNTLQLPNIKIQNNGKLFVLIRNIDQYQFLRNSDYYLYTDNYKLSEECGIAYQSPLINYQDLRYDNMSVASELGALSSGGIVLSSGSLSCANQYTYYFLKKFGVKYIEVSHELSDSDLETLSREIGENNLALTIYQKPLVMITKSCFLSTSIFGEKKSNCNLCHRDNYYLTTANKRYLVVGDENCNCQLFDQKVVSKLENIPFYRKIMINNYIIKLTNENKDELIRIFEEVKEKMNNE